MRLASLSQTTSTQAATLADTNELVARLESALALVRGEFASNGEKRSPSLLPPSLLPPSLDRSATKKESEALRLSLKAIADLLSQRSLFVGDLEATARRITEAAAITMNIERVSVWLLDDERTKVVCVDLFERAGAKHSSGQEIKAADGAPYFDALSHERTIAAEDANTDSRTSCFSKGYLQPLGIGAMLDVPIWAQETMVGVICHEHVGGKRVWTNDEETFAYVMSGLIALTLEQRAPAPRIPNTIFPPGEG